MNQASVTEAMAEVLLKGADRHQILWSTRITAARRYESGNNAGRHVRQPDRLVETDALSDLKTYEAGEVRLDG
jgi:hypothetical protein